LPSRALPECGSAGPRTVAFNGLNSLKVPDTDRNRCWMGRIRYRMGFAGYPTLRLMPLAETGTRALIGAAIGSAADRDEAALARRLLLLRPGMLVLLDYRRYPAAAMMRLYHERWEIESAYLALRHTLLNGHVLRSGDRAGLEQETWALLTLYQLLRMAMVTAVETRPGTDPDPDPDRASFTAALETARDQLTAARGICPDGPPTCPAPSAAPSWPPCCPPAAPVTAPARSSAAPPATSTVTTAGPRVHRRHRGRHRHPHPARGPGRQGPPRPRRHASAPAANPQAPHHGDHEHRAPPCLERRRTRQPDPGQAPQSPDPARRMDPLRLPYPDRTRNLHTRHINHSSHATVGLDNPPRSLDSYAALPHGAARRLSRSCIHPTSCCATIGRP
jgi:hypothetical protein